MQTYQDKKVTILTLDPFAGNIHVSKAKLHSLYCSPYAQYPTAIHIIHTPFKKRTRYERLCNTNAHDGALIVEGHYNITFKDLSTTDADGTVF